MRTDKFFAHFFGPDRTDTLRRSVGEFRDQIGGRLVGRRAPVAAVSAVLFGFGLAGVSTATPAGVDVDGPETAIAASERAGAVLGANRADRPDPAEHSTEPNLPAEKLDWTVPMMDAETTSCFGPRWGVMHAGVDLALPENAPIFSAGAGTVVGEGWLYPGYGISVVVDHGDGILTHYAHLNKTNVAAGDQVTPGHLIGWEGSTGESTGPHLHFEVHNGMWNQVDPGPWMKERGVDLRC